MASVNAQVSPPAWRLSHQSPELNRKTPRALQHDHIPPKHDIHLPVRAPEVLVPWKVRKAQAFMLDAMIGGCSVQRVARECAMSRSHFSRAFKHATGLSPHEWLQRAKVRKAEQLLADERMKICQVAQECGFGDQSYFTRIFKKLNGVTPKHWRLHMTNNKAG